MQLDIQDLKNRLDLRDLIEADLGPGRRSSKEVKYSSPFRADPGPSFSVYANGYYDFGTGEAGDVFTWLQKWHRLSFAEALSYVAELVNGQRVLPRPPSAKRQPAGTAGEPPSPDWQQAALIALEAAEHCLWSPVGALTLDYLHTARGLDDATLQHFRLGYNPAWTRTGWHDPQTHKAASLPPGIVIPWLIQGDLWALKVRCRVDDLAHALGVKPDLLDGKAAPKYLNLAGGHQAGALYNADAILPGQPLLFVEGELDAMLAWQLGRDQVVTVTLGSAAQELAPRWQDTVQACPLICSALDNDEAGQKATQRLAHRLGDKHRAIGLPAGKDLTEFAVQHRGDLQAWLKAALEARPEPYWRVVPEAWRTAISQYLPDPVAPLLELLAGAGLLVPGQLLTRPMLRQLALSQGLSSDTVRAGLEAAEVFLQNVGVLQPNESGQEQTLQVPSPGGKSPRFSRGGRGRVNQYRVLPLAQATQNFLQQAACRIWERCNPVSQDHPLGKPQPGFFTALGYRPAEAEALAAELEERLQPTYRQQGQAQRLSERQARARFKRLKRSLADPYHLPLPSGWRYRNVSEYRAVRARAIQEAQPDRDLSLKQWATTLGVSARSVPGILARAGIASSAQYAERAVRSTAEARQLGYAIQGYPRRLISTRQGQDRREYCYDPQQLSSELATGREIVVRYQIANRQTLINTEQLQPARLQPHRPVMAACEPEKQAIQAIPTSPVSPAAQPLIAPRRLPYRGPGYDPHYVRAWLVHALELVRGYGFGGDGRLIDSQTGEILADQPDPETLIQLLRDKPGTEPHWDTPPDFLADEPGHKVVPVVENE